MLYHVEQPYNFLNGSVIDDWYLIISIFLVTTIRIGFIMFLKEIDEKTILQKNIRIQKDKLKLEELNKTKNKLFSIIAHDLRSPFNGILGLSELLMETVKKFEIEKSEQYLKIIISSAQNTLVLLDNLLNWARTQTGQLNFNPQKIILTPIIKGIIQISNLSAVAKNISLVQNKTEDIEVYADGNMLKIIIRNLISNAIKFTNQGGKITVSAKKEPDRVEITISDNGVGMSEESVNKLFRIATNETTMGTADEKGSGLGLILCRELVEKHGGRIWVESLLGKGSSFIFTLPCK